MLETQKPLQQSLMALTSRASALAIMCVSRINPAQTASYAQQVAICV